ncbi:MAG: hypothetical protein ACO20H_04045 [Bacteriovoracaceae bacterium]
MKALFLLILFSTQLWAIGSGNQVTIEQKNCTIGDMLGRGAYGRVFELIGCPDYVLKEYMNETEAPEKIQEELWVHKVLQFYKINTVRAFYQQIDQNHFQIKTKVSGKMIRDIISSGLFTKNSIYETELYKLSQQIIRSRLFITELNQLNIMFDDRLKKWIVVDAAFYRTPVGTPPSQMPYLKNSDSIKLISYNAESWGSISGIKNNPVLLNNYKAFQENVFKPMKRKLLIWSQGINKTPPFGRPLTKLPIYMR